VGQVGKILLVGVLCGALTGCWQALGGAFAVLGGVATAADTMKHWDDDCRTPSGKAVIDMAKEVAK